MDDEKLKALFGYVTALHAETRHLKCKVDALHSVLLSIGRNDLEQLYQNYLYENLHDLQTDAPPLLSHLVEELDESFR